MATAAFHRVLAAAVAASLTAATGCGSIPQGAQNPYCYRNCIVTVTQIIGNKADTLSPTVGGDMASTSTKSKTTTETDTTGP
jgi:hypothetical protein